MGALKILRARRVVVWAEKPGKRVEHINIVKANETRVNVH